MGERFDMSRPIYAQIVERLKAKILAASSPKIQPFWNSCGTRQPAL